MTSSQPESSDPEAIIATQIPNDLRLWACERLVTGVNRRQAARSLIASAPTHGIDLDMMWGVIGDERNSKSPRVRQVCLAVLGAGRTAMLFHSSPEQPKTLGSRERQQQEISACIRVCLSNLSNLPQRAGLAQCLTEPKQTWAPKVCADAGMISVGELAYMRKPLDSGAPIPISEPTWPEGVAVTPLDVVESQSPGKGDDMLIEALESSYEQTLDCPELCGLRPMRDVLDSHKATGAFDPRWWLLITRDERPAGCCLLTHCPANNSIELVYLGIAPGARGLGLGRSVLEYGIARMMSSGSSRVEATEVTCAVDTRNTPAISVYTSLGFSRFDSRVGYVAPLPVSG